MFDQADEAAESIKLLVDEDYTKDHKGSEKRWLIIYFAPNYLRCSLLSQRAQLGHNIHFDSNERFNLYGNDSMFSSPSKPFSKRDQFQIIDKIRDWLKEKTNNTLNDSSVQVRLLLSSNLQGVDGAKAVLEALKAQFGLEAEEVSPAEAARQSFIGAKPNLVNYRQNSRLVHMSIKRDKTILVLGDLYKQDKSIQIEFGIQQVADSIATLRKTHQMDSLVLFVKANLYRFVEKARFFGKPQLVTFDEQTASLLSRALSVNQQMHRVNAEWVQQLCSKLIDSDFQYLNSGSSWISADALDYVSAHLILSSFLLEGLGATVCSLDKDCRVRGYVLDQMIQSDGDLLEQYLAHRLDWKRSAQDLLIRFNPLEFSRASQMALLASKIFSSTANWLHLWTAREHKILWISAFFSSTFAHQSLELAIKTLSELEGVSLLECRLIASTIALSFANNLSVQSKYLEALPPELRVNAKKMASVLQLARALDVTGRSAVQDLRIEAKPKAPDRSILKVYPRLNAVPELIQVEVLKRSFENQFEQKLEVELASNQHL